MAALRVAHIIPDGKVGGAQEYLASLVSEQTALGVAPMILTSDRGPFVQRYRQVGPVVIIPSLDARVAPFQNLYTTILIARLLAGQDIDLIHGHTSRGLAYAALVSRLLGVPAVASAHGFNSAHALMSRMGARVATLLKRAAIIHLGAITVAAEAIRESVLRVGVPGEKVYVVYAGIDARRFHPGDAPRRGIPTVGAAGRFIPIKGLRFYLEAACDMLDQGLDTEFRLYGDGPEYPMLRSLVASRGHTDRIIFSPFQQSFEETLRGWDVAVVPSVVDSFPFAVLEAMATGIPVVASAVGGIPEALHDGTEGFLVPPGRADLLAKAIRRLVIDPELRCRMGAAGVAACRERFNWKNVARDYLVLYDRVLSGRGESERALRGISPHH